MKRYHEFLIMDMENDFMSPYIVYENMIIQNNIKIIFLVLIQKKYIGKVRNVKLWILELIKIEMIESQRHNFITNNET